MKARVLVAGHALHPMLVMFRANPDAPSSLGEGGADVPATRVPAQR